MEKKIECYGYICRDKKIKHGDQVVVVTRGLWIRGELATTYSKLYYHRKCYPGGKK